MIPYTADDLQLIKVGINNDSIQLTIDEQIIKSASTW